MKGISLDARGLWHILPHPRHEGPGSPVCLTMSVALALVAAASCGPGERDLGTPVVRDSAGVTIVENPGPDQPLGVEITPVADLIPPDSALTVVPWGVTTDRTNRDDSIFFLNGPEYRIDMSVAGSPMLSFRRSLGPIEVTREMAASHIESGPGPYGDFMRRTGLDPADIVAALGYEDRISPVLRVTTVPGGRVWVTRTLDGFTPHVVDVFDASGRYEGTFDAPGVPIAFVSDSTFVALRSDRFGETTLELHRARMSEGSD